VVHNKTWTSCSDSPSTEQCK